MTRDEVVARRAIKRGCPKSFILWGRLQNAPTQCTLKVIDNQSNQLCQSVKLWQSVATKIRF